MCGFAGFSGEMAGGEAVLHSMIGKISHRGPDMQGFVTDPAFSFGFCRLSVLDVRQQGNQPMESPDGRVCLVFNGEIYNYRSLRRELKQLGYRFQSNTDTEVLLSAYLHYGQAVVHKLRGMFAFVLYDRKEQSFFGARDLFGIKPFYYTITPEKTLVFASEAKALFAHPGVEKRFDDRALRSYLTFQYTPPDLSFFQGVSKLPPGHTFLWKQGKLTLTPYREKVFSPDNFAPQSRIDRLQTCLRESVELHRQSDVPVGAFLSGGVDSGYLCALLRPEHSFSVGFEAGSKFDEIPKALALAKELGICHHHRYLTAKECLDAIPKVQYHMDEPQSNPSALPLWFLAKEARAYVTVVLSGEGADELFGGYDGYRLSPAAQRYRRLPPWIRQKIASFLDPLPYFKGKGLLSQGDPRLERHYFGQACVFTPKEALEVLHPAYADAPSPADLTRPVFARFAQCDELTRKQQLDLDFWLVGDILQKADKMSMASSLELRVPYLDREVFSLASRLRPEERIDFGIGKVALRKSAASLLPPTIAYRDKKGFPVPIRHWFRTEEYYRLLGDAFSSDCAARFFRKEVLLRLLQQHYQKQADHGRKLFTVYSFLCWYQVYFS